MVSTISGVLVEGMYMQNMALEDPIRSDRISITKLDFCMTGKLLRGVLS